MYNLNSTIKNCVTNMLDCFLPVGGYNGLLEKLSHSVIHKYHVLLFDFIQCSIVTFKTIQTISIAPKSSGARWDVKTNSLVKHNVWHQKFNIHLRIQGVNRWMNTLGH